MGFFGSRGRVDKTATALAIAEDAGCRRVLVVGPSIAAGVWRSEARRTGFSLPAYVALDSDLTQRAKALQSWIALHPDSMIVINYQAYWRQKILPILLTWQPDAIILDECQALISRSSRQSKCAHRLGALPSVRCRLALGRAIKNGVQDLYSLYRYLEPDMFPRTWRDFSERYLTFGFWNQITGSKNEEEIERVLALTSTQIQRRDVWGGLPTRRDQDWPVVLTEESATRYRQFAKDALTVIEGTDVEGKPVQGVVSADIVIAQAARLQQLLGVHTKVDGKIVDVSSEKIDAAVELAQQTISAGESVVLFCVFRREIARIVERLSQLYPQRVGVIQGGMDPEKQFASISAFQRRQLDALVIQIHAGSKAIELDAAAVGIVVSTGYDVDDFDQASARLTGTDPNRSFDYYYLRAELPSGKRTDTIDARIYAILRQKQNITRRFSLTAARELFATD